MNIHQRVEQDLSRGEYWLARQRLSSLLQTRGYDADVLDQLARICWQMHDGFAAGCYWICSAAEGAEVDQAVQMFLRHAGPGPSQIVANLPRCSFSTNATLPLIATQRLRDAGLLDALAKRSRSPEVPPPQQITRIRRVIMTLLAFVFVLALAGCGLCALVGLITIIWGDPF